MDNTVLVVYQKKKKKEENEKNWSAYDHIDKFITDCGNSKNKNLIGFFLGGKKRTDVNTLFEAINLAKEFQNVSSTKSYYVNA